MSKKPKELLKSGRSKTGKDGDAQKRQNTFKMQ